MCVCIGEGVKEKATYIYVWDLKFLSLFFHILLKLIYHLHFIMKFISIVCFLFGLYWLCYGLMQLAICSKLCAFASFIWLIYYYLLICYLRWNSLMSFCQTLSFCTWGYHSFSRTWIHCKGHHYIDSSGLLITSWKKFIWLKLSRWSFDLQWNTSTAKDIMPFLPLLWGIRNSATKNKLYPVGWCVL